MTLRPRARAVTQRLPSDVTPIARILAITLALAALAACGGKGGGDQPIHPLLVPANAYSSTSPPDSALPLTPEAFAAGLEDGSLQLVSAQQIAADEAAAQMQMEADKARAELLYATRSDVLARHTRPPPDDQIPDFTQRPDTTWLYRVAAANPTNNEPAQYVVLRGNRTGYADLVHVTERFNTRENQLAVYGRLYAGLDPTYITRNGLPHPDSLGALGLGELIDLNDGVAVDWPEFGVGFDPLPPSGYPEDWYAEEGRGNRGDSADMPPPTGLWSEVNFPLKWCVTSVKAQRHRGTCTAFGITAAVEAIIARDLGRWVNLSEQMFYDRVKQIWWPSTYGDGVFVGAALLKMVQFQYRYSWEYSWDYNPSRWRFDGDPVPIYVNSCWANEAGTSFYADEHCSESNHQATMVCMEVGGYTFCGFEDPAVDVPADAGFGITGFAALNDPGAVGTAWAKAMLALKIPVIVDITVPVLSMQDFVVAGSAGIVTYDPGEVGSSGAHTMLLVGFVPNASLPSGTPAAPGGGYFICKNSWGSWYGDKGYLYLPSDWLERWSRSLYIVHGVTQS